MRHDSQYPLRQAHYVSHSTDFANRAIDKLQFNVEARGSARRASALDQHIPR